MTGFSESSAVEDYFIKQLQKKGWTLVDADDLERESLDEPLLIPNLIRSIKKLNKAKEIGDEEIRQVLNDLRLKSTGQEGAKHILNYFKHGVPIKFEKDRTIKYVQLFDFENLDDIDSNEYIISRQVRYQNGDETRRADIVLYVNGIPLVIIECKSSVTYTTNWFDAYRQVKSYEKDVPEPFKYIQIGVAAEQIAKYFPIVPWLDDVTIEEWKEEGKDSIDSSIEMLKPSTLMDIIKNFLFFRIAMGSASKVIARYMQYRSVNKIVDRVIANLEGREEKNKGLVWHWQGSGKTFVMIFAANKLFNHRLLEKPSIFFVVDRVNLEEQLYEEFTALDIAHPEIIVSISELKNAIKHDDYLGKRGMMITLIQKFQPEELEQVRKELLQISEKRDTIMTRKNVIAFVDEGHRTQYGFTATQMRGVLKNGFFFGLTGTPIAKTGKDTYREFSYPPKEQYLDKYFILDSIKDGFTVKIAYQPRLEKEVYLKRDLLQTFLDVEYDELPEESRERIQDKVREKLTTIKLVLENPERIEKVCEDIAGHFKNNLDGKFKAMIVAASRSACVTYKNKLDKLLPKEYSEVVMTFEKDDRQPIQDYLKQLKERFPGKEKEDIMKAITTKFKEEEFPKILIVTDMLLTGFDAPILQTMYLDKPLKEHKLLQAIARTNRPYKNVKDAGLIVDYIGILKDFKKAFEMYSKEDMKGVLYDTDELRKEFSDLIAKILVTFKDIPKDRYDRETLLQAIEVITADEEKGRTFLEDVAELRRKFELLGPDQIKIELFSEYKWIMAVHTYYKIMVLRTEKDPDYKNVEKYLEKTVKYVYKSTEVENFTKDLPIIKFDEEFLANLEKKVKGKKEKAANIVFTLNKFVLVEKAGNPVFENLTQKVSRLMEKWKEKNKDFERIYKDGTLILEEIGEITKRQKQLGFSDTEYAILSVLEQKFGQDNKLVDDVKELSKEFEKKRFPGWLTQKTSVKDIEREIRRLLRKYVARYGLKLDDIDKISKKIIEVVKSYGE
jgi:type I restriction enzyme R subunit